jgi:hypothetical protein
LGGVFGPRLFALELVIVLGVCVPGGRVGVTDAEIRENRALVGGNVFCLAERVVRGMAWIDLRAVVISERPGLLQAELNNCGQGKNDAKGEGEGTHKQLGTGQVKLHCILLYVGQVQGPKGTVGAKESFEPGNHCKGNLLPRSMRQAGGGKLFRIAQKVCFL